MNIHKKRSNAITYLFLSLMGFVMIYPLIWLFFSSFKSNKEIFTSLKMLPEVWNFSGYVQGWKGTGQFSFGYFLLNTFKMVLPTVVVTMASSTLVAYGFARFNFKGKGLLFALMLSTMMLPNAVLIIPRYLLFRDFGWLDSYKPFIIPQLFAFTAFFNYMMIQFIRGIPRELDESAKMDGLGSFRILVLIILPLCKSALFSVFIFQFMWTWNDFFNPLIYINSIANYPVSLALRMSIDAQAAIEWNKILAMSFVSIIPVVALFFSAQKYFVEGIATTGLKG
ncbi:carbohydrate ABC transporter permease [Sphaerochaeta globosa]|uniref:ABC-type transporter, integral membrane subunit n=1 Tax=Sphaerochaeta globosa (strain ATCC BAA-1886 / DSM 22777 / Buddy) TaxID=158189 RepID=F0RXR8_SPHGB|nr:carbohydrate ABC transporter permease [Sphaerochaeta globosa]ADY12195.1 ABC-type transporter, integral membrane subunit [Sphaerochaeta globosa str. Buddy]